MNSKKILIVGNWKMNMNCIEAKEEAIQLSDIISNINNIDICIAPSFLSLSVVGEILKKTVIYMAAQNLFWKENGAFTGEISAEMVRDIGCDYVIIGHSERRLFFGETDEDISKKIKSALRVGLCPILCVGETKFDNQHKKTFSILDKQVKLGLQRINMDNVNSLVVAYEPVWAIGSGEVADIDQIQNIHCFIRTVINDMFGSVVASELRLLYGGSVNAENVKSIVSMPDVDGVLVGGASLNSDIFGRLIQIVSQLN